MSNQQRVPVGIRFKEAGKIYYFDARSFKLEVGNYVVVETSHGKEVGRVVIAPDQVIVSEIKETLRPIERLADEEDLERVAAHKKRASEQLLTARQKVIEGGLEMTMVAGEYSLDGERLTFYFTAEDRSDFRSLAQELSSEFDTKVQLLQVGERDRAKIVDGIGRCGERLCCSSWLTTFPAVSIKMAKDQDLPVNPSKLSGACGRLLCCLTYEYDQYREIKGGLPKVGAKISTPTGEAKVMKINVPKETVSLFMLESSERVELPIIDFRMMYGTAIRPKELADKEKELFAAEQAQAGGTQAPTLPAPSGQRPPKPSGQRDATQRGERPPGERAPGERAPAAEQGDKPAEDRPRRRRRRRGGRGRRRGGGGGGGSAQGGGGGSSQGGGGST